MPYKNPEKKKQYNVQYGQKNKISISKNKKEYYLKNKERIKKSKKEYYKNNKEKVKKYYESPSGKMVRKQGRRKWLKERYNLTIEQYDQMIEAQNGVCAICGGINYNGRRLCVDHNHKTNKVRSLLCYTCNAKLQIFEDEEFRKKAKEYLVKHK